MFTRLILTALALPMTSSALAAESYPIDARHSQVVFTYTHFGFSRQTAQFRQISGEVMFDAADPGKSSASVTIPIEALDTGVPDLDKDLKSPNFFDAAQFSDATFKSTKVEKTGADTLNVSGDLTIHGVTRPVTLAVKVMKSGEHPMKKVPALGFDATTTIKRSDFGVNKLVPMVSDEIDIHIAVEAQQPKAKP
jgi:polyisoprenoid-binding protein YceI